LLGKKYHEDNSKLNSVGDWFDRIQSALTGNRAIEHSARMIWRESLISLKQNPLYVSGLNSS